MNRDSNRFADIEVFEAIVRRGSLSGAGLELGLSPSAVSRILTRIEARLGVRLILRTTRSMTLTQEGQSYLQAARRILSDLAETEQAISGPALPRGRLRISAPFAYGRLFLVPLLAEFTALFPGIVVEVSLSDRLVDIIGGEADVAIRFGPLADSPLTARRLGETTRVIVAAPAYLARFGMPQTPEDLLEHNCINFSFRRARPDWPFRRRESDFTLKVSGNIEVDSGETLVQLAREGAGIIRVGRFDVETYLARGTLVALLEEFNPADCDPVHIVFVGGSGMPARVRVFVDFIAEKLHNATSRPADAAASP